MLFPRPLLSLYACLPHKHRVCECFSLGLSFFKRLYSYVCHVCFVMRIFPHKHRVCAVPFPRPPVKFVCLSLSCYVMRTSPHKHQFRAVLFSRLPFKFTRLYWSCFCCFSIYMVLRHSPSKRWHVVFIPLDLLVSCIYFYVLIFADSLFLCHLHLVCI